MKQLQTQGLGKVEVQESVGNTPQAFGEDAIFQAVVAELTERYSGESNRWDEPTIVESQARLVASAVLWRLQDARLDDSPK